MTKLTLEKFLERAVESHNNFYIYDKVVIEHSCSKIIITCPNHGDFVIITGNHIYRDKKQECPMCVKERRKLNNKVLEKEVINSIKICKGCNIEKEVNKNNICIECIRKRILRKKKENSKRYYDNNKINNTSKIIIDYHDIISKICNSCNVEKNIEEFYIKDKKTGRRLAICKICENERTLKNKVKAKKNKKQPTTKYCIQCDNEKELNDYYYYKNKTYSKYCKICSDFKKEETAKNYREKLKIDYRNRSSFEIFKATIRGAVKNSITKKGYIKNSHTYEILGCSYEEVLKHIEDQFTVGMSWENRNEWHIDHIIPMSFCENEEEAILLNHHTNLQPLWAFDNMSKQDNIIKKTDLYYKILENRKRLK